MKKFSIPIKNANEDFILTNNLWLTINDKKSNYSIIKKDNISELFIGLTLNTNTSMDITLPSDNLENLYTRMSDGIPQASFLYMNSDENRLLCSSPLDAHFLLFKHEQKSIVNLNKENSRVNNDEDDVLIVFSREISPHDMENIQNLIQKKKCLTYNLIKNISSLFETAKHNTIPLIIIEKSPHSAHTFSIKSSLKTINMTIDMIKNKVLQYHSKKIWQIETVLHEALVNAITYGNELDSNKLVLMSYEIGTKGLRIIIKDCGDGFDVNNISVPVGVEALERISGRGIYHEEIL